MTICRYGVSIQLQPQHGLSMTSFMQRTAAQRHVSLRHMIDCTHSLRHGFMVANMVDCPCHYSFDYVQYLPPPSPRYTAGTVFGRYTLLGLVCFTFSYLGLPILTDAVVIVPERLETFVHWHDSDKQTINNLFT